MEVKVHEIDPNGDTILILRKTSSLLSAATGLSGSPSAANSVVDLAASETAPEPEIQPEPEVEPEPQVELEPETGADVETEVGAEPETSPSITQEDDGRPEDDEVHQDSLYTIVARFRVSSAHLILASSYFKAALNGSWAEAAPASTDCPRHIYTDDWNEEALLIVMNVIHCRNRSVPRDVDLEMLTDIAVVVDYYKCYEAMDLFVDIWFSRLRSQLPAAIGTGRSLSSWLFISWVFRDDRTFKNATKEASRCATGPIHTWGLPIPQSIIGK